MPPQRMCLRYVKTFFRVAFFQLNAVSPVFLGAFRRGDRRKRLRLVLADLVERQRRLELAVQAHLPGQKRTTTLNA